MENIFNPCGEATLFPTGIEAISKADPLKSHRTQREQRRLRSQKGEELSGIEVMLATECFVDSD